MKGKTTLIQVLVLIIGAVLGGFIAQVTNKIPFLSWLSYGQQMGLKPTTLDLGFLNLTFGLEVHITIAAIVGLILAVFVLKKL